MFELVVAVSIAICVLVRLEEFRRNSQNMDPLIPVIGPTLRIQVVALIVAGIMCLIYSSITAIIMILLTTIMVTAAIAHGFSFFFAAIGKASPPS